MINVGNIQVREGASIPKAQHGTMTKGLAPAEYNIGIDPLVGPWESLSDLETYMISSGRKDKQGNPLFINGQETTIVGSDGIPHKYIRSNGAWLAMNYSGGAATYTSDVYDTTLDKNQDEVNSDLTEAIGDINDSISSIQDDISPLTASFSLQQLAEYDGLEVYKGGRGKHNRVYIDDQNLAMNFGYNNSVSNTRKLAFGFGQQLDVPDSTFVIGQRNSYEPNAAFIVGNGTLDGITNNAFVIGRDGNFWVYGINGYAGQQTEASQYNSVNHFITGLDTRLTALESSSSSGGGSSNNVAAEDVSYNASTAYTSGNVGYEIKQIETDLSTRLKGIKTTGDAENNSGAAIGYCSHALAYRGRQRMYDAANQEYINVIYTNAGTVSVGEDTCAIGEFSFAAGQGNNGGGNVAGYYYHVASSYEAGDEYIYLQEEPVGQYISFKESPYDEPSGDHVAKIVSKSYDGYVWEVRLAEPYIDRNINADSWVYPITGSHGQNSSSFGMHTIAQGDGSTVVGKYNYPMPNELFSVGCGTDQPASSRKNALIVLDDGSIYIKGVGNYDGTNAGESGVLSLQDMLSSLGFGNTGNSSGSDPYGSDPYASDPYGSDPYESDPYGSDPYESDPYGSDPYGGGY